MAGCQLSSFQPCGKVVPNNLVVSNRVEKLIPNNIVVSNHVKEGLLVPNNQVMYNSGTSVVKRLEDICGQTTQVTQVTMSDIVYSICVEHIQKTRPHLQETNNVLLKVNTKRNA